MRIRVTNSRTGGSGGVLVPVDPGNPQDVNDIFELERFSVDKNPVRPFADVKVDWRIVAKSSKDDFDDFEFQLIGPPYLLEVISTGQGTFQFPVWKAATLQIRCKSRLGGPWQSLGSHLDLQIDKSECTKASVPLSVIDLKVFEGMGEFLGNTAELRYRSSLVPNPNDTLGPKIWKKNKPSSKWTYQSLKYYFPFEIVIPNYFNMALDVKAEFKFRLTHNSNGADLDVLLEFSKIKVKKDIVDNIIHPFGPLVAATAIEKLLPLVFECRRESIERLVVNGLLAYWAIPLGNNRRFFTIAIDPGDGEVTGYLLADICEGAP